MVVSKLDVRELGAYNVAAMAELHPDDKIISILDYADRRGFLTNVSQTTYAMIRNRDRPGSARLLERLKGHAIARLCLLSADLASPRGLKPDRSGYPTSSEVDEFNTWYSTAIELSGGTPAQFDAFLSSDIATDFSTRSNGDSFMDTFIRSMCRTNAALVQHLVSLRDSDRLPDEWKRHVSTVAETSVASCHKWFGISETATLVDAFSKKEDVPRMLSDLLKAAINRGSYHDADVLFRRGARVAVS